MNDASKDTTPTPKSTPNARASEASEINEAAARYSESIPIKFRNLYLKAVAGKASPRQTIKAKCQECVGYEEVVSRVRNCSSLICPNYAFRPYQERSQ